jgi:ABC-type lipoprotein release transport system permease subunit
VVIDSVALLLATVALVATWLPARRAARVNPPRY